MIARVWRGTAGPGEDTDVYFAFLSGRVLPSLPEIPGYRGARVLRRSTAAGTEFVVTTLWDSMEAVRAFAGDRPERAVVEPEARAVLVDFEETVQHYEVALDSPIGG